MIGFAALLMGSTAISPIGDIAPTYSTGLAVLFNSTENLTDGVGSNLNLYGNIKKNISDPKFGQSCMEFGPGFALANFNNEDSTLNVGTSDFTCEFHFKCDGEPGSVAHLFGKWYSSGTYNVFRIYYDPATNIVGFQFRDSSVSTTRTISFVVADPVDFFSRWNHVAFQRRGTLVECFVNGVAGSTYTIGALGMGGTSNTFAYQFGGQNLASSIGNQFTGLIDEFRFTIGIARYTGPFTPPSAEFPVGATDPNWSSVKALLKFNDQFGYIASGETANKYPTLAKVGQNNVMFAVSDLGIRFGANQSTAFPIIDDALDFAGGDFSFELWGTMGSTLSVFMTSSGVVPITIERTTFSIIITIRTESNAVLFTRTIAVAGSTYRSMAICRTDGVIRTYLDGVLVGTDPAVGDVAQYQGKNLILATNGSSDNLHIKAFRFTKGEGLYQDATYTVPSAESVIS